MPTEEVLTLYQYKMDVPQANFDIVWGEENQNIIIYSFHVKKNLINRIKWGLFFIFFPFHLRRWDK